MKEFRFKDCLLMPPHLESFVSQIPLSYRYKLEHAKVGEKVLVFCRRLKGATFDEFFKVEEVVEILKTGYKTSSGIFFSKVGRSSGWEFRGSTCFKYCESILLMKCYYDKLSLVVKFVNDKALSSSLEDFTKWHPVLIDSFVQL